MNNCTSFEKKSINKANKNKIKKPKLNFDAWYSLIFAGIIINIPSVTICITIFSCIYNLTSKFSFGINILIMIAITLVIAPIYNYFIDKKFPDLVIKIYRFLYFHLSTKCGKAISRKDFKKIKNVNLELYNNLKTQQCYTYCYFISYVLLKTLRKGFMRIIAYEAYDDDGNTIYKVHVLYVNNDWCFDTNTVRQYSLKAYAKENKHIIYKDFFYNDILNLYYLQFNHLQKKDLEKWCKAHGIKKIWKEDK